MLKKQIVLKASRLKIKFYLIDLQSVDFRYASVKTKGICENLTTGLSKIFKEPDPIP